MKDTKPFNLEHAKAGAPVATAGGSAVQILKWDGKKYPIIGVYGDDDSPASWNAEGLFNADKPGTCLDLVMTPLGTIDGKPVFYGDEIMDCNDLVEAKPGCHDFKYCSWPAPAKQYPVTLMCERELYRAYDEAGGLTVDGMIAVANAALRHAIDNGQVIVPIADEQIHAIVEAQRAARDMAIAESVQQAAFEAVREGSFEFVFSRLNRLNLSAIIAKVQA